MIRPALVKQKFGNGKRLIALWPIMHRPLYYLVYVDDSWSLYNSDENPLIDHLDDIYEEIAAEFGERSDEDMDNWEYHWPEADLNDGSTWAETTERAERLYNRRGISPKL